STLPAPRQGSIPQSYRPDRPFRYARTRAARQARAGLLVTTGRRRYNNYSPPNPPSPAPLTGHSIMPDHEPNSTSPPPQPPRSALFIVFLVVVIDLLGFGIVLPLLPRLGDVYISQLFPGGKEGAAGGAVLGGLLAIFSLMQFLFAPA